MSIKSDNAKPILFSGPMVRAILAGKKTQTRRIVRYPRSWLTPYANGDADLAFRLFHAECDGSSVWNCGNPKTGKHHWQCGDERLPQNYQVGDRLWVKETFATNKGDVTAGKVHYRADDVIVERWKPSIFMPRWASRLTLEVVSVRVERLKCISERDAVAEGIEQIRAGVFQVIGNTSLPTCSDAALAYQYLWRSINGHGSWEANPWVWVVDFKQVSGDSKVAS